VRYDEGQTDGFNAADNRAVCSTRGSQYAGITPTHLAATQARLQLSR
jgi:hypothetical protein